jgi:hypothetical protein
MLIVTGQPIQSPVVQCAHCASIKTRFVSVAILGAEDANDPADFHCSDCGKTTRVNWRDYLQAQRQEETMTDE